jgi:hypothetical protein
MAIINNGAMAKKENNQSMAMKWQREMKMKAIESINEIVANGEMAA